MKVWGVGLFLIALSALGQQLHLGGSSFDPTVEGPALPAEWTFSPSRNVADDFYLIQLNGKPRTAWLSKLRADGLEIIQYLAPNTYIVWGSLLSRAEHPFIRWQGPFEPGFRVSPALRATPPALFEGSLLVYRQADLASIAAAVRLAGGSVSQTRTLDQRFWRLQIQAPGAALIDLARTPGVYTLQEIPRDGGNRGEVTSQINVNQLNGQGLPRPGYSAWLALAGYDGAGVVMSNVDTGLEEDHSDLIARMTPCVGQTCGGTRESNHGTHTAAIMAGDAGSGATDNNGFLRGLGVAPGATLVEQYYPGVYLQPGGMLLLMTESARNNAVLSSNSWGPAGSPRGYDVDTLEVDIGVRDADPDEAGLQALTYVLAIMNGNGGISSQGTPDEGKNMIRVGATIGQQFSGALTANIDSIGANSAHGPALDGRFLPDLVAPGRAVDSAVNGNGHGLLAGTSMAAPQVAGAAALLIQAYRDLFGGDPSPAMIKALLVATTRDLAGNFDADGGVLGHRVDSRQGWGRMDVIALLDALDTSFLLDQSVVMTQTDETWSSFLQPRDPQQPVRVMLVWTDAPGHGLGGATPAWNNDLDLQVVRDGQTYRGNQFGEDGWSTQSDIHDERNNSEGVFLTPDANGFTVTITAANLNSDAIPGDAALIDQDFALVCINCIESQPYSLEASMSDVELCVGQSTEITVDLLVEGDDPGALPLTVIAPDGVTVSFDTDQISTGQMRTLTIDAVEGAGGQVQIQAGEAPNYIALYSLTVGLTAPLTQGPQPKAPTSGEFVVARPRLSWFPQSGAMSYRVEIADNPSFTNPWAEKTTDQTELDSPVMLAPNSTYYWRVRPENLCGPGPWSSGQSLTILAETDLLLIDDHADAARAQTHATLLSDLDVTFTTWNVADSGSPDATDLESFEWVWFLADAPLNSDAKQTMQLYLAGGGRFALIGENVLPDGVDTTGFAAVFGVDQTWADQGFFALTDDDLLSGYGPFALNQSQAMALADRLTLAANGEALFRSDVGIAAVGRKDDRAAAMVSFPLQALSDADRIKVGHELLDWLGLPLSCLDAGDLERLWPNWNRTLDIRGLIDCTQ